MRESGFWRFVNDPADPPKSDAIELLLAHSAGYVELFYGRPLNQSSWELATDALRAHQIRNARRWRKRLDGIVEGGDLAYVEERVDADGGLVPNLSARLRYVGGCACHGWPGRRRGGHPGRPPVESPRAEQSTTESLRSRRPVMARWRSACVNTGCPQRRAQGPAAAGCGRRRVE